MTRSATALASDSKSMTRGRPRHAHPPPAQLRSFNKRALRLSRLAKRWCFNHRGHAQRALLAVPALLLLALLVCFAPSWRLSREEHIHMRYPSLSRFQLAPNHTQRLLDEHAQAVKLCGRHILSPHMEELRTCNQFEHSPAGKVVALVELRNVRSTLTPFLSSLAAFTHSVIALDDHSTDGTRNELLTSSHVELILNRTGEWRRDELADRQMLLEAGRRVGATHFVLLDYDEFISHNCLPRLREQILDLKPGESMFIPWVEAWHTPFTQRVMKDDAHMNFLTRRQTVIFADDRYFSYTAENSLSRTLSNNASLHVLRCPRSICAPPGAYKGASSRFEFGSSVKVLHECRIVEMRFLNLHNVLLKSAWYEALGRVLGAEDGVTSGKMITRMFTSSDDSLQNEQGVFLADVERNWLAPDAQDVFEPFQWVESWRASELLQWIDTFGADRFHKLPVMSSIHFGELRLAMRRAMLQDTPLRFVPRRKRGVLVFAMERASWRVLSRLLRAMRLEQIKVDRAQCAHADEQQRQYEQLKTQLEAMKQQLMDGSHAQRVYVSFADVCEQCQRRLLLYATQQMANMHVLLIFGDWHGASAESALRKVSRQLAQQAGSHVHVIDMPLQAFGSFAALHWLCERVRRTLNARDDAVVSDEQLVAMAEGNHDEFEEMADGAGGEQLWPVARLVFSLNVGRSGSRYLADVLGTADEPIVAVHEPRCPHAKCSGGGAMRMQDVRLDESYKEREQIKLPMIRNSVASVFNSTRARVAWRSARVQCAALTRQRWAHSQRGDDDDHHHERAVWEVGGVDGCAMHQLRDAVFAETNPNFKAWMYDVVLQELPPRGYDVTLVVVRRYVAAVVCSLYDTGYFSTRDGYKWMETAAGVNSRVGTQLRELRDDAQLDAVQKLLSYVLNAEAVFRDVLRRFVTTETTRVRAVQVRAESMFDARGTAALLRALRLRWSARTARVAGVVRDKYVRGGDGREARAMTLAECERRIARFEQALGRASRATVRELLSAWGRVDGYEYGQ